MTAPPATGDILLGKYRVERVIGQGGMGMVLAARHTGLGELFAIKLMLAPEGASGRQAVDRFLREARIGASLKGEHVVKVQDVGELDDGRPYMVMEYLEGQDLASVIEKRGPLPIAETGTIMLQACEALAEAHSLGIVHRDIKPANIFLIQKPNGKPSVKLLDFGISKRIHADTKALTATGAMMGSPMYMSPEQLSDARAVGPQSDIWSMGVVLYELVTARAPFDGDMIFEIIQKILNEKPEPPRSLRSELPAEIDDIIEKSLRKKPEERYASIDEFASDVRQLMEAKPVAPVAAAVPRQTNAEREFPVKIAIVAILLLMIGGGVVYLFQGESKTVEQNATPEIGTTTAPVVPSVPSAKNSSTPKHAAAAVKTAPSGVSAAPVDSADAPPMASVTSSAASLAPTSSARSKPGKGPTFTPPGRSAKPR